MLEQGAMAFQRTAVAQCEDGRRERGNGALMIMGDDGSNNEDDAEATRKTWSKTE